MFAGYGDTTPRDGDKADAYDVMMYGVEGLFFPADNVMAYGQFAFGDKVRAGDEASEGFVKGNILRFGAIWFRTDDNSFTVDVEAAAATNYIDRDDPGVFVGITFSGESRLGYDSLPVALTYFARYDFLTSTDEGDAIQEISVGAGLKILLGNKTKRERFRAGASIGTPRLPTRASAWTEWMD